MFLVSLFLKLVSSLLLEILFSPEGRRIDMLMLRWRDAPNGLIQHGLWVVRNNQEQNIIGRWWKYVHASGLAHRMDRNPFKVGTRVPGAGWGCSWSFGLVWARLQNQTRVQDANTTGRCWSTAVMWLLGRAEPPVKLLFISRIMEYVHPKMHWAFGSGVYGGQGQHHHLPVEYMRTISGFWRGKILLLVTYLKCVCS